MRIGGGGGSSTPSALGCMARLMKMTEGLPSRGPFSFWSEMMESNVQPGSDKPTPDWLEAMVAKCKHLSGEEQEAVCEHVEAKLSPEKAAALRERLRAEAKPGPSSPPQLIRRLEARAAEIAEALPTDGPSVAGPAPLQDQSSPEPEPEGSAAEPSAVDPAEVPFAGLSFTAFPGRLSPQAPYETAKQFVRTQCFKDGVLIVYFWQGCFWRWNGTFYEELPEQTLRGQIYEFLASSEKWSGERFHPTPKNASDVLDGLRSGLAMPIQYAPPAWLDTGAPASGMVVLKNGVVNVETGERLDLTPRLWVHSALQFNYSPEARAPNGRHSSNRFSPVIRKPKTLSKSSWAIA